MARVSRRWESLHDHRTVRDFSDLRVWNNAMGLVEAVYTVTRTFPPGERFGLSQQMPRCAVSIPSNIAEGQSRGGTRDFARFLGMARGSAAELRTQLSLSHRLGYVNETRAEELLSQTLHVSRQLTSQRNSLLKRLTSQPS
ncbi:MAG: four helix bundle protein [Thermomicrobiales bacterium]